MRITAPGSADVTDRTARVLGEVAPRAASVWDTSDRTARVLGEVAPRAASVWDVSDRLARLLGEAQVRLASAYGDDGNDGSRVGNPAGGTIIATTGDLPNAGLYEVDAFFSGTASAEFGLRWRDSLNATKEELRHFVATSVYFRFLVRIVANDDIVLIMTDANANVFSGWLSWRRLL